jgi:large subunit ribosomal protein L21
MFAVFKTGGKQYRVAAEDVLKVDKVKGAPGEIVEFGEVLLVAGDSVTLGAPTVAGATVAAEVLDQARGPKIIAFKKRRRKNSRRKRGHRQEFTLLRITEILTDGQKPSKTVPPRRGPRLRPPRRREPWRKRAKLRQRRSQSPSRRPKSPRPRGSSLRPKGSSLRPRARKRSERKR